MSSVTSKRKTRKNGLGEASGSSPEGPSTEFGSISDRDFEEITSKVERSLGRKIKEQSEIQQEMLKMLNAMQSRFDELTKSRERVTTRSGRTQGTDPHLVDNEIDVESTYVPYGNVNVDVFPRTDEDCDIDQHHMACDVMLC